MLDCKVFKQYDSHIKMKQSKTLFHNHSENPMIYFALLFLLGKDGKI